MSSFREVQLKSYEILNAVVNLCEKYNINYKLSSGTLLGAIRHNGFIPWDNDIDIEMPIEDYRRFLKLAKTELPGDLFLQTYYSDPGYNEMWAKVRANNTTSVPVAWKRLKIHLGIGIDVFPVIRIYKNPTLQAMQKKAFGLCRALLAKDFYLATNPEEHISSKLRLVYMLPRCVRIAACRIMERFIFRSPKKELITTMVDISMDYKMDRDLYEDSIKRQFETREFLVPKNYDYVLTRLYGDYMTPPPESERNGHEGTLGKIIYDCNRDYKDYIKEI